MTLYLLTKWTMVSLARIAGTWLLLIVAAMAVLTGMGSQCAQAQSCVQPPGGLVGWWPGDGNADDIVGGNHGTLHGAASFVPGEVDQAFGLGPGGYVDVPRDPAIFALTEGTVEMWFRILDLDAAVRLFEIAESGVAFPLSHQWGIDYRGDDEGSMQVHFVRDGTIVFAAFTPPVINDTNFHHVAVVADGVGTIEIYVDGVLQPLVFPFSGSSEGFFGDAPNADNMKFGAIERNDLRAEGDKVIDEVGIYNRPLTASEIQTIYNAGSAGKCKVTSVQIDIKPGSADNSINLKGKGNIPVAILTTAEFDAQDVDPETVLLGDPGLDQTVWASKFALEDVDADGDLDLLLHFDQQTLLNAGALNSQTTILSLTGETYEGDAIEGSDVVKITK